MNRFTNQSPQLRAFPMQRRSFGSQACTSLPGNAIDFHVQVLGLSFHDAMRALTDP